MARPSDLVVDSKLQTSFSDSFTVHSFLEIDAVGARSYRNEQWKWVKTLGSGGFGQVLLQKCVTPGPKENSQRAVKVIDKQTDSTTSLDLNRELEAIAKFSNERYTHWFVKSFGWYEDPNLIFITMEYCHYGDLRHYLADQEHSILSVMEAQNLVHQIVEGLDLMHKNGFAHRDLKPGNILIKSRPPDGNWWIVLADFGISKRADETSVTTKAKGTIAFMAPELLGLRPDTDANAKLRRGHIEYLKAADMWALGEITFRMLTGGPVFEFPLHLLEFCRGERSFPSDCLPSSGGLHCADFICRLMTASPEARMTTSQCLEHRWIESQRLKPEAAQGRPNMEQTSAPRFVAAEPTTDFSASWNTRPNGEAEPLQVTAICRPDRVGDLDDEEPSSKAPDADRNNPSVMDSIQGLPTTRPTQSRKSLLDNTDSGQDAELETRIGDGALNQLPRGAPMATTQQWDSLKDSQQQSKHSPEPSDGLASLPTPVRLSVLMEPPPSRFAFLTGKPPRGLATQVPNSERTYVAALAFSPDGKTIVYASGNYTVRTWDGQSVTEQKASADKVGEGRVAAISSDTRTVAFGDMRGTLVLWNRELSKSESITMSESRDPTCIAFSPDGQMMASGYNHSAAKIWQRRSGSMTMRTLSGYTAQSVAFSADGSMLAAGSDVGIIRLFSQLGERLENRWPSHSCIRALTFSPNGKLFASGSDDSIVRLWDATSKVVMAKLTGHKGRIHTIAFSPDGTVLASGSKDKTVRLWDVRTGELLRTLKGHKSTVTAVAFSPGGDKLASGSYQTGVLVWT